PGGSEGSHSTIRTGTAGRAHLKARNCDYDHTVSGSSWVVGDREAGTRLDKFLAAADRLGSRGQAATALDRGKIFVNDAEASRTDAARRLEPGDRVRAWI